MLVTPADLAGARKIIDGRATRHLSPDRPHTGNPTSQLRGALGEVVAARWLWEQKYQLDCGFLTDASDKPDITIDGCGIEVMTAQFSQRQRVGFAVPPNKLWAAERRGAAFYLFVGVGAEFPPNVVLIQAFAWVKDVAKCPVVDTQLRPDIPVIRNHVIPAAALFEPDGLRQAMEGWRSLPTWREVIEDPDTIIDMSTGIPLARKRIPWTT